MVASPLCSLCLFGDPRVFRAKDTNGVSHLYTYFTGDKVKGGDLIVDGAMLIKDYKPGTGNNMGFTFNDPVADPVTAIPETTRDIAGNGNIVLFDSTKGMIHAVNDAVFEMRREK